MFESTEATLTGNVFGVRTVVSASGREDLFRLAITINDNERALDGGERRDLGTRLNAFGLNGSIDRNLTDELIIRNRSLDFPGAALDTGTSKEAQTSSFSRLLWNFAFQDKHSSLVLSRRHGLFAISKY
jgi:hypothetical protein